jgi:hypothetical protein
MRWLNLQNIKDRQGCERRARVNSPNIGGVFWENDSMVSMKVLKEPIYCLGNSTSRNLPSERLSAQRMWEMSGNPGAKPKCQSIGTSYLNATCFAKCYEASTEKGVCLGTPSWKNAHDTVRLKSLCGKIWLKYTICIYGTITMKSFTLYN